MKTTFLTLLFGILFLSGSTQEEKKINRTGLIVEFGMGSTAIVDEYISNERYSGSLPYIGIWYGRQNTSKGFLLGFSNQESDQLMNNSIRANFDRVSINFDQYFSLKGFKLAGKEANWYLGPSVEYFEYELANQFTSTHKSYSELVMLSMGINSLLDWQFANKFSASLFVRSNVIGVNYKDHDESKYPDQDSKFQTLITANNINADLYLQYHPLKRLSVGIKGKAQYTRSTGWDESESFANSLILFVTIHF